MCHLRCLTASLFLLILLLTTASVGQTAYGEHEKAVSQRIRQLRSLPDEARGPETGSLALDIRKLPASTGKLRLASSLQSLSTEGDFGHDVLQAVTDTLTQAIVEAEPSGAKNLPYSAVAWMVRYYGVKTTLEGAAYSAAMAELESADLQRQSAGFTLTDMQGKKWTLSELKGKVVIVNFWATWCPPCVREAPDLQALYAQYKDQGLVVLGVADDDVAKIKKFAVDRKLNYPMLYDPEHKTHAAFRVESLPATFVYNREGKLVEQLFDLHTRAQFEQAAKKAGL